MLLYLHMKDPLHSGDGDINYCTIVEKCGGNLLNYGYTWPVLHWVTAQFSLVSVFLITVINYLTRNSLNQEVILAHSLREQPRR